jgi:3beta-hydroxy-delta5-steroid dehydrogenase/steroid delta-isomerase
VDGHIEAARHLIPGSPLGGQAYFITDGAPMNYFEFFRPLILGMGFAFPRWRVPMGPLHAVTWLWEGLHRALRIPPPPLTCHELSKLATTHYFRIYKARRDFGWEPKVGMDEAWERSLAYCQELLVRHRRRH